MRSFSARREVARTRSRSSSTILEAPHLRRLEDQRLDGLGHPLAARGVDPRDRGGDEPIAGGRRRHPDVPGGRQRVAQLELHGLAHDGQAREPGQLVAGVDADAPLEARVPLALVAHPDARHGGEPRERVVRPVEEEHPGRVAREEGLLEAVAVVVGEVRAADAEGVVDELLARGAGDVGHHEVLDARDGEARGPGPGRGRRGGLERRPFSCLRGHARPLCRRRARALLHHRARSRPLPGAGSRSRTTPLVHVDRGPCTTRCASVAQLPAALCTRLHEGAGDALSAARRRVARGLRWAPAR